MGRSDCRSDQACTGNAGKTTFPRGLALGAAKGEVAYIPGRTKPHSLPRLLLPVLFPWSRARWIHGAGLTHAWKIGLLFSLVFIAKLLVKKAATGSTGPCQAAVGLLGTVDTASLSPDVNLFWKQIPLESRCCVRSRVFVVPGHITRADVW